jgi:hypothetical protein
LERKVPIGGWPFSVNQFNCEQFVDVHVIVL